MLNLIVLSTIGVTVRSILTNVAVASATFAITSWHNRKEKKVDLYAKMLETYETLNLQHVDLQIKYNALSKKYNDLYDKYNELQQQVNKYLNR